MKSKSGTVFMLAIAVVTAVFAFYRFGRLVSTKWHIYTKIHSAKWRDQNASIVAQNKHAKVIFIGNSLTRRFDLKKWFNDSTLLNAGIGGDFTEGVLLRLDGILDSKPRKIFLEIGINDVLRYVPQNKILDNIDRIITRISTRDATVQIYLQSLLPVCFQRQIIFEYNSSINKKIRYLNSNLERIAETRHAVFVDLFAAFTRNGRVEDLIDTDGVHLKPKGYAVWKMAIEPYVYAPDSAR